jgi:hypothetical protein
MRELGIGGSGQNNGVQFLELLNGVRESDDFGRTNKPENSNY